jgi:hypothetical protein
VRRSPARRGHEGDDEGGSQTRAVGGDLARARRRGAPASRRWFLGRKWRGDDLLPRSIATCDSDPCPFSLLANNHYDQLERVSWRLDELQDSSENAPSPPISTTPITPAIREEYARKAQQRRQRRRELEAQAWREAFPDLPPDKLDRELLDWWLAGASVRLPRIPITVRNVPVTERTLGEPDVLAVRSWLHFLFTKGTEAQLRDAEAALAMDRTNVLARLVEAATTHSITPEDARATAAAHPTDWRALRLVESALYGTPEGDAARARVCSMSANTVLECRRAPHRQNASVGLPATDPPGQAGPGPAAVRPQTQP